MASEHTARGGSGRSSDVMTKMSTAVPSLSGPFAGFLTLFISFFFHIIDFDYFLLMFQGVWMGEDRGK